MLLVPAEVRERLRVEREGWPPTDLRDLLAGAGLRPTKQRLALCGLLFCGGRRHFIADDLHQDAICRGFYLSLATVYNSLNQFAEAGLVRRVRIGSERNYFDTDVGNHCHFYVEVEDRIVDIPPRSIRFDRLPSPPAGYRISKVDVVIRLKRIATTADIARPGLEVSTGAVDEPPPLEYP